jgi:hypothetical protein
MTSSPSALAVGGRVSWIERYRQLWEARFDELDKVVEGLKRKERVRWT